jgi:hypothetical protein
VQPAAVAVAFGEGRLVVVKSRLSAPACVLRIGH